MYVPKNVISEQIFYAASQVVSSKESAVYGQRYIFSRGEKPLIFLIINYQELIAVEQLSINCGHELAIFFYYTHSSYWIDRVTANRRIYFYYLLYSCPLIATEIFHLFGERKIAKLYYSCIGENRYRV